MQPHLESRALSLRPRACACRHQSCGYRRCSIGKQRGRRAPRPAAYRPLPRKSIATATVAAGPTALGRGPCLSAVPAFAIDSEAVFYAALLTILPEMSGHRRPCADHRQRRQRHRPLVHRALVVLQASRRIVPRLVSENQPDDARLGCRSSSDASPSPRSGGDMISAPASDRTASPEPRWETLAQSPPPTGFGAMSVDRHASGSVRPKVILMLVSAWVKM
jgi:hypothetical protein